MDNRGIPARVNSGLSEIQRYDAYHRIQDPSESWPFGRIYDYTHVQEVPEPSSRRINAETENVADENNRETPIVISSGSESDSDDDAAIAKLGNIGNDSAINPVMELANVSHCPNEGAQVEDSVRDNIGNDSTLNPVMELTNVSHCPNEGAQVEDRKGKRVASGSLISFTESESETDSEDDAAIEHRRQFNVAIQESLNTQNGEAPESSTRREAENVVDENNLGAEYDRELEVAILESLNTHALQRGAEYDRQVDVAIMESLNTHALWREHELLKEGITGSESVAAEGNIGNDSVSNPVMELANVSHCPNEDSIDEAAQVEALEADIGKFINSGRTISNIEPTESNDTELAESMPRLPVSSRGRTLKPTVKQLELSNAIGAPLPSKRKRKDGASIDRQTKQKAVKPTPAVPRFNEGDITLNRRPRGFLRRQGVADVSERRGPGSVVGQASLANGMANQADVVNPNGSGAGVKVGLPEPSGSGSVMGQAGRANGVTLQADVVDPNGSGAGVDVSEPLLEPMVCVTNQNPMDLTIEEAIKYLRSENRVSANRKVKLFGTYIS